MNSLAPICVFLPPLSLQVHPVVIAIAVLIVMLPATLLLLGFGFVSKWIWHRLRGSNSAPPGPAWRYFKWAVLGMGGISWFAFTVTAFRSPRGQRPESAAISNLRTINTAQVTYLSTVSDGKYGTISNLIAAGLLDSRFDNTVFGYVFRVTLSDKDYIATAMPASREAGKYGYVTSGDAVIRYAETASETCKPCFPDGLSGKPVP